MREEPDCIRPATAARVLITAVLVALIVMMGLGARSAAAASSTLILLYLPFAMLFGVGFVVVLLNVWRNRLIVGPSLVEHERGTRRTAIARSEVGAVAFRASPRSLTIRSREQSIRLAGDMWRRRDLERVERLLLEDRSRRRG